MRIALGCDHAGTELKRRLAALLVDAGHDVADLGTDGDGSVDYPEFAVTVGRAVVQGRAERGILICGTGIGMSMAANKLPGVRAAKCNDPREARLCREHNDANVLCLGARILDPHVAETLARIFVDTRFAGGRHQRRVALMDGLDDAARPGASRAP